MEMCDLEDSDVWKEKARAIWPDLYDKVGGKDLADQALAIPEIVYPQQQSVFVSSM